MRVVHAVKRLQFFRECDDFVGLRKTSGRIEQSRRHSNGAVAHGLPHQCAHGIQLHGCCGNVTRTNNSTAECALADEQSSVWTDALCCPLFERGADIDGALAVVAREYGRHSLHEIAVEMTIPRATEFARHVCVRVDKSWRYHESARINCTRGGDALCSGIAHEHNAIAANANVGGAGSGAGAINDASAGDEYVDCGLCGRGARRDQSGCEQHQREWPREAGVAHAKALGDCHTAKVLRFGGLGEQGSRVNAARKFVECVAPIP